MADNSPGSSPSIRSQTEQVLPQKKNNESGDRKGSEKERSLNAVSAAARTKLTHLIQLASEAEEQTDYKKVVDTVFDSVGKYIFYLYICKRCNSAAPVCSFSNIEVKPWEFKSAMCDCNIGS